MRQIIECVYEIPFMKYEEVYHPIGFQFSFLSERMPRIGASPMRCGERNDYNMRHHLNFYIPRCPIGILCSI
jgi:hypothetical protein